MDDSKHKVVFISSGKFQNQPIREDFFYKGDQVHVSPLLLLQANMAEQDFLPATRHIEEFRQSPNFVSKLIYTCMNKFSHP